MHLGNCIEIFTSGPTSSYDLVFKLLTLSAFFFLGAAGLSKHSCCISKSICFFFSPFIFIFLFWFMKIKQAAKTNKLQLVVAKSEIGGMIC